MTPRRRTPTPSVPPLAVLPAAAVLAFGATTGGCAAQAASVTPPSRPATRTTSLVARSTSHVSNIDRLTSVARKRYATEHSGSVAHAELRRVAADPRLRRLLSAGNTAQLQAYVQRRFAAVWYHQHVSRLRILRGSRMLVDVGVPFVVAPAQTTLRDRHGRALGRLQISIQDVVGFVRYMHRNYPVDVVARGVGAGHTRTSLPAALRVSLPNRGTATIAGRRYQVRHFTARALDNERVNVWILAR